MHDVVHAATNNQSQGSISASYASLPRDAEHDCFPLLLRSSHRLDLAKNSSDAQKSFPVPHHP